MGQLCTNLDSGRFALYNSGYRELSDKGKKIVFLIYDDNKNGMDFFKSVPFFAVLNFANIVSEQKIYKVLCAFENGRRLLKTYVLS